MQRLKEGLDAARDAASQDESVDPHVADPGCAGNSFDGWPADAAHLDGPALQLIAHASNVGTAAWSGAPGKHASSTYSARR